MKFVFALTAILFVSTISLVSSAVLDCYQCDSVTDEKCIKDVKSLGSKACADNLKCYTQVEASSGKVTRGCLAAATTCNTPDCMSCDSKECNNQVVCKSCDSSKDKDCAQTDSSKATFNSICTADNTKCISLVKDKAVQRRCASADDERDCKDATTCALCTGANCNVGIFPANRRVCYQCDGEACGHPAQSDLKPCAQYDATDKCYIFAASEKQMLRGCVSDGGQCATPAANALCKACDTNHCNDALYSTTPTIQCLQCSSTAEDASCKWGQAEKDAKVCSKPIMYNQDAQCYTQTKDDQVHRGCVHERDTNLGVCNAENGCVACNSNACNTKDSGNYTCIRCRSDINTECRNNADKVVGTECRESVTSANTGCFYGKWNDVMIRGCLVDLGPQEHAICVDAKNDQCTVCRDKINCNTKPSSASTLQLSMFAAILMAVIVLCHTGHP